MANIQIFEYQNNKVRTVDVDGEAWFVLKDVCAVLGISNNRMAADRLDDDERCKRIRWYAKYANECKRCLICI